LADLSRTVYPHSGHPSAAGRAQDRVNPSKSVVLAVWTHMYFVVVVVLVDCFVVSILSPANRFLPHDAVFNAGVILFVVRRS